MTIRIPSKRTGIRSAVTDGGPSFTSVLSVHAMKNALRPSVSRPRISGDRRLRMGAVHLELIIAVPILVIALLAIIEFGRVMTNLQQVALASRAGASEAAQTNLYLAPAVPLNVKDAVNRQLASAGLGEPGANACRIIVEHNVGATPAMIAPTVTLTDTTRTCTCSSPGTLLPARQAVRVTVCIELTSLAPNLLKSFGFDIKSKSVQHSTTFRYEGG